MDDHARMMFVRVAIVVYDGVLAAECEAFSCVLALMDEAEVVMVGSRRGTYAGPGGRQVATASFDDVDRSRRVDVAVVPGGIGCERAADDPALRDFLHRMERSARYVAASSTGTVVLASAGLLHGEPAATHWLAGDLLRRYGSDADHRRIVTTGNVITCEGQISAVDAAFEIVERLQGPGPVTRIRATLLDRGEPLLRPAPWWSRPVEWARSVAGARARGEPEPRPADPDRPPVTPLSVMIELVDDHEDARRLKRAARHRRRPPTG